MLILSNQLCACGCGQTTFISQVTRGISERGKPNAYLRGHNGFKNPRKLVDMIGKKFGKLTVISRANTPIHLKGRGAQWLTKCECGTEKRVRGSCLRQGMTKSCGCSHRTGDEAKFQRVWNNYLNSARDRHLEITFTRDELKEMTSLPCYYCLRKTSKGLKTSRGFYIRDGNGLDRVDNTKGYTKENCCPACFRCNQAKSETTQEEFFNWIKTIYEAHRDRF